MRPAALELLEAKISLNPPSPHPIITVKRIGVAERDVLAGGNVPLRHQRHAAVRHALHLHVHKLCK